MSMSNKEFVELIERDISTEVRKVVRLLYKHRHNGITVKQILSELGMTDSRLRVIIISLQRTHKLKIRFDKDETCGAYIYFVQGLDKEDPLRTWQVQLLNKVFV